MPRLIRLLPLCLLLLALPALAQQRPAAPAQPPGPRQLGTFRDWTAATYQENGQKICYAFTRASKTEPNRQGVNLPFYTGGNSAFARDGAAAVAAMRSGNRATARGPAAGGRGTATDQFSLAGFSAAHDAISRECPARR